MTNFDLALVIRDLRGKVTTQNLSIPMAMLVHTLAVTETVCMKRTIGHMGAENIQLDNMVMVKVKGIQNTAMIRSATARLMRKPLRSVLERLPRVKTSMTSVLPTTAKSVVNVYNMIRVTCDSRARPKFTSDGSAVSFRLASVRQISIILVQPNRRVDRIRGIVVNIISVNSVRIGSS